MATTEGIGLMTPRPTRVRLEPEERRSALRLSRERCRYRQYSTRADTWGQGLLGDELRPVMVGFVGEIAFAKWAKQKLGVSLPVDSECRVSGDGGIDFRFGPWGVQVKTATSNYAETLVRCRDLADPSWHIIVRAQWPIRGHTDESGGLFDAGPRTDWETCELRGWSFLDDFRRYSTTEPARVGEHNNYCLAPQRLTSMDDLACLFAAKLNMEATRP